MAQGNVCPSCGHWDKWSSGPRGRGCDKTTNSGPCNSDWENCCCTHSFHAVTRCTELKVTFTIAEANDWRTRWPFMKDGRCGNESYASTGPCEAHISRADKLREDLRAEEAQAAYSANQDRLRSERELTNAREVLKKHGLEAVPVGSVRAELTHQS